MSMIPRHELWRRRYRLARDLDHLSPDQLSERLFDCINNARLLTDQHKIGFIDPHKIGNDYWYILSTEVQEECNLRGYDYPGPISINQFGEAYKNTLNTIPDMGDINKELIVFGDNVLLKFGDRTWLPDLLNHGHLRISSASSYDNSSLSHARNDKELTRSLWQNSKWKTYPSGNRVRKSKPSTKHLPPDEVTFHTDYLLSCYAQSYSSRLFGDFPADSCLVIFDKAKYIASVKASLLQALPGWNVYDSGIKYYDPVRVNPDSIIVPTYKPFKHTYQCEHRIIAIPPEPIKTMDKIDINIGPLHEYARLYSTAT